VIPSPVNKLACMMAARSEQTPGRHLPSDVSASIRSAVVSTINGPADGAARVCRAAGQASAASATPIVSNRIKRRCTIGHLQRQQIHPAQIRLPYQAPASGDPAGLLFSVSRNALSSSLATVATWGGNRKLK